GPVQRHRAVEDGAEGARPGPVADVAVGRQRHRARGVTPPPRAAPGPDAVTHRASGHRRGDVHGRLAGRCGAHLRHPAARLPGRGDRPVHRAPDGRDRLRRRARVGHKFQRRVRADTRGAAWVHRPRRRGGSSGGVWVMAPIIEVEKLSKSYGGKRGIIDVSFSVGQGEVFGFLGPNGAGKTTTIRILMALIRADGGTARIAGLDVWEKSLEIHRLIGYVPGEPSLDRNLTGADMREEYANLRGGVDRAYLKKLIERLDLDTSRKFRQYSTGNKRKVVLIQAFMHRPRMLILDEPTSGLDPLNQQEFDGMVKEARDEGRTVFLSSHVLSEVEKTCTRVAIIRDGGIVR